MAAVTATNIQKHSSGDQIKVTATLTDVTDTNTFDVPHIGDIEDWTWAPTSAPGDGLSAVITLGNRMTLTAVNSGTQDGVISVYGR